MKLNEIKRSCAQKFFENRPRRVDLAVEQEPARSPLVAKLMESEAAPEPAESEGPLAGGVDLERQTGIREVLAAQAKVLSEAVKANPQTIPTFDAKEADLRRKNLRLVRFSTSPKD